MIKDIVFDFNGVILDTNVHKVNREMVNLVDELVQSDYHLYLFSNTLRPKIEKYNSEYEFLKYFEKEILSSETGFPKPMYISFKNLLKVLDRRGDEILFIDDERKNLEKSLIFHIKTLKYDNDVNKLRNDLKALGILN